MVFGQTKPSHQIIVIILTHGIPGWSEQHATIVVACHSSFYRHSAAQVSKCWHLLTTAWVPSGSLMSESTLSSWHSCNSGIAGLALAREELSTLLQKFLKCLMLKNRFQRSVDQLLEKKGRTRFWKTEPAKRMLQMQNVLLLSSH